MTRGSAPRVRGIRLIFGSESPRRAVQPRACGEYVLIIASATETYGSAPRVRGIRRRETGYPPAIRFSPARAGNTIVALASLGAGAVQPRACGEYQHARAKKYGSGGSAPRVRGIQITKPCNSLIVRFSPARAGNTRRLPSGERFPPVQPRACGEYGAASGAMPNGSGSAPRVRGIRVLHYG